jgi:hypothetical protein
MEVPQDIVAKINRHFDTVMGRMSVNRRQVWMGKLWGELWRLFSGRTIGVALQNIWDEKYPDRAAAHRALKPKRRKCIQWAEEVEGGEEAVSQGSNVSSLTPLTGLESAAASGRSSRRSRSSSSSSGVTVERGIPGDGGIRHISKQARRHILRPRSKGGGVGGIRLGDLFPNPPSVNIGDDWSDVTGGSNAGGMEILGDEFALEDIYNDPVIRAGVDNNVLMIDPWADVPVRRSLGAPPVTSNISISSDLIVHPNSVDFSGDITDFFFEEIDVGDVDMDFDRSVKRVSDYNNEYNNKRRNVGSLGGKGRKATFNRQDKSRDWGSIPRDLLRTSRKRVQDETFEDEREGYVDHISHNNDQQIVPYGIDYNFPVDNQSVVVYDEYAASVGSAESSSTLSKLKREMNYLETLKRRKDPVERDRAMALYRKLKTKYPKVFDDMSMVELAKARAGDDEVDLYDLEDVDVRDSYVEDGVSVDTSATTVPDSLLEAILINSIDEI